MIEHEAIEAYDTEIHKQQEFREALDEREVPLPRRWTLEAYLAYRAGNGDPVHPDLVNSINKNK